MSINPTPPSAPDTHVRRLEIVAVIILTLATLLTAWNSFEAAHWTRIQSVKSALVVRTLLESNRRSTLAGTDTLVDLTTFTTWTEAVAAKNQPLADFYRSRFRAEFKPAFEAWMALDPLQNPNAPPSPFAMPQYSPANQQAASELKDTATKIQEEVTEASSNASYHMRNTLFLAMALFFIGISRMFTQPRVRYTLVGMALLMLLVGLYYSVTGPIA